MFNHVVRNAIPGYVFTLTMFRAAGERSIHGDLVWQVTGYSSEGFDKSISRWPSPFS